MFEGFNPTKTERAAIDRAHAMLSQFTRSDWELNNWTKQEAKGYGNRHDRLPMIAARGLIVKWFLDGINSPDQLLRQTYNLRPTAVYMAGLGADNAERGKITAEHRATIRAAVDAYDAAFNRMIQKDRAALYAA